MRSDQDSKSIFDYSHYVEVVDEEECGCGRLYPNGLLDHAKLIGAPGDGVFRYFPGDLGSQISAYFSERLEVFGLVDWKTNCPYCGTPLSLAHEANRRHNSVFGQVAISVCSNCGWWESMDEATLEFGDGDWYKSRTFRRRALLKEFSVGGSETPIHLLHQHLAKDRNAMYFISPSKLEHLVGRVFSEFMSCESIHLGGPGDGGIDLILVRGEQDYVVQVKRRASPESVESVSGIREFIGAMLLKGGNRGLFVTTAPRFSQPALAAAQVALDRKIVDKIELIDGNRLFDICKLTTPSCSKPWERFVYDEKQQPSPPEQNAYFAFPVRGA
ncbi:MAG: restriction endonuclease [Nitrosomonas sp.]|uniref:restriction endonuclease n=1 Tax=Nitrosomonas sp. TaxID=42353 RepID=UPI0027352245|nr:restriction endonuclease [Nitrosomonas sp.]MDP3281421.1 restriction endonuclease [Nitrosomonas sp.]MDP3664141.1 restriction endonuclease [Nitrosomonas sp.]MDZ4106091.1 restriction endonuclease [Nitrosomonas sp.]